MKIYTKTGDAGTTALFGGARVPKHHIRIESYGTLDELNSTLGLLRTGEIPVDLDNFLMGLQQDLFVLGSQLAAEPGKVHAYLPTLKTGAVEQIEMQIDALEGNLPPLKNFILPGGHPLAAQAHICRCICRRAERLVCHLAELEATPPEIVQYLNRLSDYFFVLARTLNQRMGIADVEWHPS
jgi:cob(I)alamin adenosyltransferase